MTKQMIIDQLRKRYDVRETHISWVLLDEKFAYKIKKPVKFWFLDFSTLEKRSFFCEEEVRLNSRFSPEIYLGVVPISADKNGRFQLNGNGKPIEYAVKMKRLPDDRRMDNMLKNGNVKTHHIEEISRIVAEFHLKTPVVNDIRFGSANWLKTEFHTLNVARETIKSIVGTDNDLNLILERADRFIDQNSKLFQKRQRDGRIRECHGDLHSKNIFLTDRPVLFDCIEFNNEFRFLDCVLDISYMAMDLERWNRKGFSRALIDRYLDLTKDDEALPLMDIYKCFLASVRTKVAALKYQQNPSEATKKIMIKYLNLCIGISKSPALGWGFRGIL